jgi:hypothetical protein
VTQTDAIRELFVAFGAHRNTDQAKAYLIELERSHACGDCAEIAATNLLRTAKRLPPLVDLLNEVRDVMGSDVHTPHVAYPMLAPRSETWWRTDAVRAIMPFVGEKNLALFVAAQMWWSSVPQDITRVTEEIRDQPIWINAARTFTDGRDLPALVEAAFRRARWAAEHPHDEPIAAALLNLEVPA